MTTDIPVSNDPQYGRIARLNRGGIGDAIDTSIEAAVAPLVDTLTDGLATIPGAVSDAVAAEDITGQVDAEFAAFLAANPGVNVDLESVQAASTTNLALTGAYTVDGRTMTNGDRYLARAQTAPAENGVYVYNSAGAHTRATDMDAAGEFLGRTVFVVAGTANVGKTYLCTSTVTTVGTDAVAFVVSENVAGETAARIAGDAGLTAATTTNRLTRYEGATRANLIDFGPGAVSKWIKSTSIATFEYVDISGRGAYMLAHTSNASVGWDIQRDTAQTVLSYRIVLESKTGGTGSTTGRVTVAEIAEPEGTGAAGYTTLGTPTTIQFPVGNVAAPVEYDGTISLNAGTSRLVFTVELQGASALVFSEPVMAYGAQQGMRVPAVNAAKQIASRSLPHSTGFRRPEIRGAYNPTTELVTSVTKWYVNASGQIQITTGENSLRYFLTDYVRTTTGDWEYTVAAQIGAADVSTGAIIALGDGAARRFYVYLANGFVGAFDSAGTTIAGGVIAGMPFVAGQVGKLRVVALSDNSGFIEAISPAGQRARLDITSVPSGSVAVGWRRATTGFINSLSVVGMAGMVAQTESRVSAIETIVGSGDVVPLGYTVVPNFPEARDTATNGFGFTETGLDRWPAGSTFAGSWLIGNDGRFIEGDGSPLAGKAHIIDPSSRTILRTYDFGLTESVQGVAALADDTFWIMHSTLGEARHYNLDGTEIVSDRLNWAGLGYTGIPNGMAYDGANNALWITTSASATGRLISCVGGSLLDSVTLATATPDQLHYDSANGLLYATTGGNGSDGTVHVHRVATDTAAGTYGPLPLAQAIEGVFVDRNTGIMHITNDGQFHDVARPALNILMQFRVPLFT